MFGLQNYGECWSAAAADKTYKRDGPSNNCLMILQNPPPPCDINNPQECAGKENVNYVYSLGEEKNHMNYFFNILQLKHKSTSVLSRIPFVDWLRYSLSIQSYKSTSVLSRMLFSDWLRYSLSIR